ncbi:MAG TPA: class I SAM-dependent methyltransferase [archaeon]|nr:class I SAM-dependent methyltransferase [archaeon]
MANRVCPWWMAYTFDHPLRKLLQSPEKILGPYLEQGMTVLDLGCGMGFFSIAMAEMIGAGGRVIAVDLQPQMLEVLRARAEKKGVGDRIITRACKPESLDVTERVDFALAFYMVHEVPDKGAFLAQVAASLKPGAKFLLIEPGMHVSPACFNETIELAGKTGLRPIGSPRIRLSRTCLFKAG